MALIRRFCWFVLAVSVLVCLMIGILLILSAAPPTARTGRGVVSARLMVLRSPADGTVEFPGQPPRHGTFFRKGETICTIVNPKSDSASLDALQTEKLTLESRCEVMKARLIRYRELREQLEDNTERYRKFSAVRFETQLKQNESKLVRERAELARAKLEFEANSRLVASDAIKRRDFENSEAAYHQAQARIAELENQRAELSNVLAAVRDGVFLGDGHNDVPYSRQRLDQLVFETAFAESALAEAERRLLGIEAQLRMETQRMERSGRISLKAPFDALVWRIPTPQGGRVTSDGELMTLLDCDSVFLDAAVPEKIFTRIARGDEVRFRLAGDSGDSWFAGTVISRIGAGADDGPYVLAARLNRSDDEFRVWIRPAPADLKLSPANFFKIGHRAEVVFPSLAAPEETFFIRLRRWWNL